MLNYFIGSLFFIVVVIEAMVFGYVIRDWEKEKADELRNPILMLFLSTITFSAFALLFFGRLISV